MPTLLQINSARNCGSTGKIAEQIANVARNHGWSTYIAHGYRYNRDGDTQGILVTGKYGEYVHYVKSLLQDAHGLGSSIETRRFVAWLDSIKPDVVHLHNIHGYYLNYRILFEYLRNKEIPIVWTLHDCWAFTGHCMYFDRIGCEKWRTHCEKCPQKSKYPQSLIDRSSRNYDLKKHLFTMVPNITLVPVSDWLHELVAESYMSKYPIRTIHNGIDLEKFKPSENSFRKQHNLEGKFMVLGVADGYGQRKGIPEFNKLSERFSDDVKIVMVGLTENEKKQISSKIIGMGRTSNQQELIDIYSTADVFINPTYEDNFPTTNIEALACGTPVVTYRTGGSPEALDENTGLVVDKGDVEGLISAISTIRNNGKSAYSNACRERAVKFFNKDDRFEDYLSLYKEVMTNSKQQGI